MSDQQDTVPAPQFGENASRADHLATCKQRALAELDADPHGAGPSNAIASMASDLGKHPDTAGHPGVELGYLELMGGFMRTPNHMRKHIEGYQ